MLIYHQHILLIACEPLLNLMTNYLICVAGNNGEHRGLQDGTNYYTLPFCIPLPHFQYREDIYAHPCFQASLMITSQTTSVVRRRKKFSYKTHGSMFLKRLKDGRSIIHRHWPKVVKTFNMNEG